MPRGIWATFLERLTALPAAWTATGLVILAWLGDAVGGGAPAPVDRGLVALALAIWGVRGARWAARQWAISPPEGAAGRWLLALVSAALALRLVGLDFELIHGPRGDEGVYYVMAHRINAGTLVPNQFHYGHFKWYADALVFWIHALFAAPIDAAARAVYGLEAFSHVDRLLMRLVNAVFSALTVIPVFRIGRMVAGLTAAASGALLIAVSPIYNETSHLAICDVPTGFFAALCVMYAARLTEAERLRDYLLAGSMAGLAVSSKYHVAALPVAIFAVWLSWRLRTRSWSWSLLGSALAAIATLVAVMPGLVLRWRQAFAEGGYNVTYGLRLYRGPGWDGVRTESPPLAFMDALATDLGWAALLIGVSGWFLLPPAGRRKVALLLPFPVLHLLGLFTLSVFLVRTLYPMLPVTAALVGAGVAGWSGLAWRRLGHRLARAATVAVVAVVVAVPAVHTVLWDLKRTRPGTLEIAHDWMLQNVAPGAAILSEHYTPRLRGPYRMESKLRAAYFAREELRNPEWDFLLLSNLSWGPMLAREQRDGQEGYWAARYREMFAFDLAKEIQPERLRAGPSIRIHRIDPERIKWRRQRRFRTRDVAYPPDAAGTELRITRGNPFAAFKDYFQAGRYVVRPVLEGPRRRGWLHVVSRDNVEVGAFPIARRVEINLPRRDKYFFRLQPLPGTAVRGLSVRRVGSNGDGDSATAPDAAAAAQTDRPAEPVALRRSVRRSG